MKSAAVLSLTLNLLLGALVLWLAFGGAPAVTGYSGSGILTNRTLRVKRQPPPPPAAGESAAALVEINEPFHWAQIESPDYRIYVANLRGIGCPEPTVRDLIIADVNDLFHPRVKALVDEVSGQFWSLLRRQDDFEQMVNTKYEQLRALDDERDELFRTLFGDRHPLGQEQEQQAELEQRERWERVADFLPEDKRARFVAANEQRERAWQVFLRAPGLTDEQRTAKRKELDADHERTLKESLAPDEVAELNLRQSRAANLRDQLVGVELSEEEIRLATKIQNARDDKRTDSTAEAAFQELLGPERHAAFERAADPSFAPIFRVAQRLELPDAAAAQAYDIRKQAEAAAQRVQADNSLSADARQATLQALGAETKQSLSAVLGPKGFPAYEKLDGGWMQQFATPAK